MIFVFSLNLLNKCIMNKNTCVRWEIIIKTHTFFLSPIIQIFLLKFIWKRKSSYSFLTLIFFFEVTKVVLPFIILEARLFFFSFDSLSWQEVHKRTKRWSIWWHCLSGERSGSLEQQYNHDNNKQRLTLPALVFLKLPFLSCFFSSSGKWYTWCWLLLKTKDYYFNNLELYTGLKNTLNILYWLESTFSSWIKQKLQTKERKYTENKVVRKVVFVSDVIFDSILLLCCIRWWEIMLCLSE